MILISPDINTAKLIGYPCTSRWGLKGENAEYVVGDISYVAHPVEVQATHLPLALTLVLMTWSVENLLQAVASGAY